MAFSRRRMLLGGAAALLSGTNRVLLGADRRLARVVLHNASVWTVDPLSPAAQAIAIADGRILAVGSNEFVLSGAVAGTRRVDGRGVEASPARRAGAACCRRATTNSPGAQARSMALDPTAAGGTIRLPCRRALREDPA
jgi:hypothetical protein